MSVFLDLADIQGNILTAYGKLGFPKGQALVFHIDEAGAGRRFVEKIRHRVTTAQRWSSAKHPAPGIIDRPKATLNIAFTFEGLAALKLSVRTLNAFPAEFAEGMAARAGVVGDTLPFNAPDKWDLVWQAPQDAQNGVHILITLNAQGLADGSPVQDLEDLSLWVKKAAEETGGVRLLTGHRGPRTDVQDMSALMAPSPDGEGVSYLPIEHFGYVDGISDPVFEGQYPEPTLSERARGGGAITASGDWRPLKTGEFLLGYPDEAQEEPPAAMPLDFVRNGTFFAYRKLHQNVVAFETYMAAQAQKFGAIFGIFDPKAALETLYAKVSGRWRDGVPVILAPTFADWLAFNAKFPPSMETVALKRRIDAITKFRYTEDPDGSKCPVGAHLRRANPRDMLDPFNGVPGHTPTSVLNNRRRILRRGLPYGACPPGAQTDDDEHGIIMLNTCASLFRQFEFVQQQWINFGMDFNAGNDSCPLVGAHSPRDKFVIPADPKAGHTPFVMDRPPPFVTTRGGDYFFAPSLTALRLIAMGLVDPT